jgi:subtilisin family serine protease
MSNQEYKALTRQLQPFITLLVCVASMLFLTSCGGGEKNSIDQLETTSSSIVEVDEGAAKPLAISEGTVTVPNGWVGRAPVGLTARPLSNGLPPVRRVILTEVYGGLKIARRELLITTRQDADYNSLKIIIEAKGWKIVSNSGRNYQVDVSSSAKSMDSILEEADLIPGVVAANVNAIFSTNSTTITDDPIDNDDLKWHITEPKIDAAWALLSKRDPSLGIEIGVIDQGFKFGHKDLKLSAVITNLQSATSGSFGSTCATPPSSSAALESPGCTSSNHGMNVAGIIAAEANNFIGSAGVGHKASPKVFAYSFATSDADMQDAINYLAFSGVKAINISMGLSCIKENGNCIRNTNSFYERHLRQFIAAIADTVTRKNILFVQSAGNDGEERYTDGSKILAQTSGAFATAVSGRYRRLLDASGLEAIQAIERKTIVVGAYKKNRTVAAYSTQPSNLENENFLVAPGGEGGSFYFDTEFNVVPSNTIAKNNIYGPAFSGTDRYIGFGGTSQAAPHVTGVAALVMHANDKLKAEDVKNILIKQSVNVNGSSWKQGDGLRYLNAEASVKDAIARRELPDCMAGVKITRSADLSIQNPDNWGNITCAIGKDVGYVTLIASNDKFYVKYEEGRVVDGPFSYKCVLTASSWSCSGVFPYINMMFDMNANMVIDEGVDFGVATTNASGFDNAFLRNGCTTWAPPNYIPPIDNPPIGYIQLPLAGASVYKLYADGSNSGLGSEACVPYNVGYNASARLVVNHYTHSYAIPWVKLKRASSGSFRLTLGKYLNPKDGFLVTID